MTETSIARNGYTLIEILVAITVIAIVAFLVVPGFQEDERLRVRAAAAILTSDIEYAQVLNIAHPDEPVVVRFDPADSQYWLAYEATPDQPILRSDTGEPYLVTLGVGRASTAIGVTFETTEIENDELGFDAQGAVADFSANPEIVLRCGDHAITLSIAPHTGSISDQEGP